MSKIKRLFLCFVALWLLCCCCLPTTFAQNQEVQNLTIVYKDQNNAIVDCEFQVFMVASLTSQGQYVATKPYESYGLVFNQENIHRLAYTLEGYVAQDQIVPTKIGTTNEWGFLVFENLPAGLYLVLASRHIQENHAYETQPFIVSLAGAPQEVQVFPKSESQPPKPTQEKSCKVLKIWDDKGFEKERPTSVRVNLLENGKLYDSVVLSEKNNWRYTWSGLNPTSRFVVVEQKTNNYIPFVAYQGITYTITNEHVNKGVSSTPSSPSTPTPPNENLPPEKLPQTGQLWWPVPVLFSVGLVFVILGLISRRGAQ